MHNICEFHGEYDFGSYKRGYQWAEKKKILRNYDNLILCNDSVFGPFSPLEDIFKKFDVKEEVDFWGVFGHFSGGKNIIQSYFVVLKSNVFNSDQFKEFIYSIKKLQRKKEIIAKYEVGLSQILDEAEFHSGFLYSSSRNSPHDKGALDLINRGFPFLKILLFKDRYFKAIRSYSRKLIFYKKYISQKFPNYPIEIIKNYLDNYLVRKKLQIHLLKLYFYIPVIYNFLYRKYRNKEGHLKVKICRIPIIF